MIVGIKKVVCTCKLEMKRTGGTFGGDSPATDTYYCRNCQKHIIVVTPKKKEQEEFSRRLAGGVVGLLPKGMDVEKVSYGNKD